MDSGLSRPAPTSTSTTPIPISVVAPSRTLHFNFHHSHQFSAPVPISHGLSPADGIGSPTDAAYTPPGVLTKLDSIVKNRLSVKSNPGKMMCSSCSKKGSCLCKKCTQEKLKFYSRRENLSQQYSKKERLQREVIEATKESTSLVSEATKCQEHIFDLRKKLENARMRVEIKRKETEKLSQVNLVQQSQFEKVFESQMRRLDRNAKRKAYFQKRLEESDIRLANLRVGMCVNACHIFPLREEEGMEVYQVAIASRNTRQWAVVNDDGEPGRRYRIRHGYLTDELRQRLTKSLSSGALSLPPDLHPPLTAIMHTVQLVNLFNVIFNFRPPVEVSHRNLCIRDRWSRDMFLREWRKLCDAVVYLCSYVGMDTSKLTYALPHTNLCDFSRFVIDRSEITKIGSKPLCNMAQVQQLLANQRPEASSREDEEDESWIIVN